MLQMSLLALGVGTLCATAAALNGAEPIELAPAPQPRPAYLALGGELVELAAQGHGPGCFAPMLDELRRHPHWSIRIDDRVWDDVDGDEPDPARAMLVIDGETGIWRDGALPRHQNMSLTGQERRDVLAAFSLDCRVDRSLPVNGFEGRYVGLALGEDGPAVASFPTNSPIAVRLEALFDAIRARYIAGRADDLHGFSLELAGTMRDYDDRDRPIRKPHLVELRERDLAAHFDLEDRIRMLDWAMAQPVSLPAGKHIVRGTLRAYGYSRPIAVDLMSLGHWRWYSTFSELAMWESIERPWFVDATDPGAGN